MLCRRRTYKAAKVVGEEPQSCDPAVSEWGNPRHGNMAEPRYAWKFKAPNSKSKTNNKSGLIFKYLNFLILFVI